MRARISYLVCCGLIFSLSCAAPSTWTPSAGAVPVVEATIQVAEPSVPAVDVAASEVPSPLLDYADIDEATWNTELLDRLARTSETTSSDAALALTGFQPASFSDMATPQASSGEERTLPAGIGFTAGPSTFLLGGSMDIPIDENLTAGPALHLGFSDSRTLVAPFAQVRYWIDIDDDKERGIRPFVQGGFGAVYLDKDGRGDDWGPLLNVGAGIRLKTGSFWRIGSTMLVNFVPGDVVGESVYFSWEVVQIVFPM